MPRGIYDRKTAAKPKSNAFQKLVALAEKERDAARTRLSAAEAHADCIHQRRLKAARTEHDQWVRMLDSLSRNLTVPVVAPPIPDSNGNGHITGDIGDRRKKPGPLAGRPRTGVQSRFDRCPGRPGRPCTNSKPTESELCARCAQAASLMSVGAAH